MRVRPVVVTLAWAIVALAASALVARGDQRFRIVEEGTRRDGAATIVSGRVYNNDSRDVVDVYVTAEGVSESGAVLAAGIAFVSPIIRGRSNATFTVKVPFREGEKSFRLSVSSYREGVRSESP